MGQSGLPSVRLHDGRRGAGSQAFAAGVAPKVIQAMLGHSSLRMTMDTYTSIMPGLEEAAAEASVDLVANAMEKIRKKKDEEAKDRPDSAEQEAEEDDDGGEPVAAWRPGNGPAAAPFPRRSHPAIVGACQGSGIDHESIKEKQKPQVTASENPGASTEPPSGFEPETYALRVRCSGHLS